MTVYEHWIQYSLQKQEEEGDERTIGILDVVDHGLPGNYTFTDFQVDFDHILRDRTMDHVQSECLETDCFILQRHQRSKEWYSLHSEQMDSLFFVNTNSILKDGARRAVVVQQCLDSIHYYLKHRDAVETLDIQQIIDIVNTMDSEENSADPMDSATSPDIWCVDQRKLKDIDLNELCKDKLAIALNQKLNGINHIESGSGSGSQRFNGYELNKLNSTNSVIVQFNKFVIPNPYDWSQRVSMIEHREVTANREPEFEAFDSFNSFGTSIEIKSNDSNLMLFENVSRSHPIIQCDDCFVEQLFTQLLDHNVSQKTVLKLHRFIESERFDTGTIIADCELNGNGNGMNEVEHSSILKVLHDMDSKGDSKGDSDQSIHRILDNLIFEYHSKVSHFSAGYRYYYWPFYKENEQQYVIISDTKTGIIIDHNEGYQLKDWYIECRYSSFKEEILTNSVHSRSGFTLFSVKDWMETMTKSILKYKAYRKDPGARILQCGGGQRQNPIIWSRLYNIRHGDTVTIPHLMALLFYINYPKARDEFLASFRKMVWNETDQSLKRRHSSFGHQGRLLRELVECFGAKRTQCLVERYYYGTDRNLGFKSTEFAFHGPLAATSGLLVVLVYTTLCCL